MREFDNIKGAFGSQKKVRGKKVKGKKLKGKKVSGK
jgi:hypothetical protein